MPQYSKEQLTGKSLEELRAIAAELDIKPNGLDERTLMYEILDQSAVRYATSFYLHKRSNNPQTHAR